MGDHPVSVSIPFKRESTWKVSKDPRMGGNHMGSFNSLQTGKHMESNSLTQVFEGNETFQFPSNGKAHGKVAKKRKKTTERIKFQFPSNGKAHGKQKETISLMVGHEFQFPSNGKAHGKNEKCQDSSCDHLFQFPSNGKAHGKNFRMCHDNLPRFVSIPFKRESTWKASR